MNKQQLYDLINDPAGLNEKTLAGLQELVAQYPFFQAGRLLLLKNLHVLDSFLYEPELKRSAIYISDRTRLFELIHGLYPEKQKEELPEEENVTVEEPVEIKEERPPSVAVTGNVGSVSDYFGVDDVTETIQGGKVGFSFNAGEGSKKDDVPEELMFDYERNEGAAGYSLSVYDEETEEAEKEGSLTFEDWLSFVNSKTEEKTPDTEKETEKISKPGKNKTIEVIDKFLSIQDKTIKPKPEPGDKETITVKETEARDSDELMTETLAKIYVKQGHYSKALKIFEKLSLKYPEKSVYFAQQIEKVEKLISNQ